MTWQYQYREELIAKAVAEYRQELEGLTDEELRYTLNATADAKAKIQELEQ